MPSDSPSPPDPDLDVVDALTCDRPPCRTDPRLLPDLVDHVDASNIRSLEGRMSSENVPADVADTCRDVDGSEGEADHIDVVKDDGDLLEHCVAVATDVDVAGKDGAGHPVSVRGVDAAVQSHDTADAKDLCASAPNNVEPLVWPCPREVTTEEGATTVDGSSDGNVTSNVAGTLSNNCSLFEPDPIRRANQDTSGEEHVQKDVGDTACERRSERPSVCVKHEQQSAPLAVETVPEEVALSTPVGAEPPVPPGVVLPPPQSSAATDSAQEDGKADGDGDAMSRIQESTCLPEVSAESLMQDSESSSVDTTISGRVAETTSGPGEAASSWGVATDVEAADTATKDEPSPGEVRASPVENPSTMESPPSAAEICGEELVVDDLRTAVVDTVVVEGLAAPNESLAAAEVANVSEASVKSEEAGEVHISSTGVEEKTSHGEGTLLVLSEDSHNQSTALTQPKCNVASDQRQESASTEECLSKPQGNGSRRRECSERGSETEGSVESVSDVDANCAKAPPSYSSLTDHPAAPTFTATPLHQPTTPHPAPSVKPSSSLQPHMTSDVVAASDQSADTASDSSQDETSSETGSGRDITHLVRKRQPNLGAVPIRSNLKRRHAADTDGGSEAKRARKCIQFDGVTVFYFPRAQGFTCIPSQGGSTLGMADSHCHAEKFTLADHVSQQRAAHRQLLTRLRLKQRKHQPSASSSEDSDGSAEDASDISDSELDVDSYFFLRPVTTRQRRAMLRASGVRNIEPLERDECRHIRTSREFCGCACKMVCRPDVCQCAGAGIKCQVDRQNFPCGCTREGCHNPTGRIEFNPARVRSHYVETIMREQPTATASATAAGAVWASCGWQKADGATPQPHQQYMTEQQMPAGYQPSPGAFAELGPAQYQEDSYSENSDGSRDSYDGSGGQQQQQQPPRVVYPASAQTQSHYSSFSFEGGLQSYGSPTGAPPQAYVAAPPPPPPPPPPAPPLAGYQPTFPACQAYPGHSYPPQPHYSYPFTKFPPSGPGPGGGGGGAAYPGTGAAVAGPASYPAVCGPGSRAAGGATAALMYQDGCGATVAGPGPPPVSGYPSVCYPPYVVGTSGSGSVAVDDCSYAAAPPPVYATAAPYDAASCAYRAGGASVGDPAPPASYPAAPVFPAAAHTSGQQRNYTDLRSVAAPAVESLSELLQNKLTGWPAGVSSSAPAPLPVPLPLPVQAASVPYCGTPQSEDSGVEVDECAAKHPISSAGDETIGEILKKTMVESVSA